MLPDKCSVTEHKRQCPNPPEFIVSILAKGDEYMVGVTCERHRQAMAGKARQLQEQGRLPCGSIRFSPIRAVGTDCINANPDDFVSIDSGKRLK